MPHSSLTHFNLSTQITFNLTNLAFIGPRMVEL